jgi:hypothetical protein
MMFRIKAKEAHVVVRAVDHRDAEDWANSQGYTEVAILRLNYGGHVVEHETPAWKAENQ